MKLELQAGINNPPLGPLVVVEYLKSHEVGGISVKWGDSITCVKINEDISFCTEASICRYLARLAPSLGLYGFNTLQQSEVDHWISLSLHLLSSDGSFAQTLRNLDAVLERSTYLTGNDITIADISVWGTLYGFKQWHKLLADNKLLINVIRWFKFLSLKEEFESVVKSVPQEVLKSLREGAAAAFDCQGKVSVRKDEGKFAELPGAVIGEVVVRFPPEASGYLHIGHAKAALLNQHYQLAFQGKLIMRFDDTNPAKETAEFEKVILEDVSLLQIEPNLFTHTSDYFEVLLKYCEDCLQNGFAYCDDTDPEIMKIEREQKKDSKNRNNSVEVNLQMWREMLSGSEFGVRCCVRAKIDMNSSNGCMRDPTIYRCKVEEHLRTGKKYNVYPTYDFACPIVDSLEGVTHALRTTEYHDRDEQYYWFIEKLCLRKPHIMEYSRLNMSNTVLSKRKLTWFVNEGIVDGWDDPRMPTVRGILRRGMTVDGLRQFIVAQGSSRSVVVMEWDKIWAINKKVIDPIAPRYTALETEDLVEVKVERAQEEVLVVQKHPKNPSVGTKNVFIGPHLLIEQADALTLVENQSATFINWGNLLIGHVKRNQSGKVVSVEAFPQLEDKDYKKTVKLTFLAKSSLSDLVPCICVYFDHIVSKAVLDKDEDFKNYVNHNTKIEIKMFGEPEMKHLKKGDVIQVQRKGYFICDCPYQVRSLHTSCESPLVLHYIPDGHAKELVTLGLTKRKQDVNASVGAKKCIAAAANKKELPQSSNITVGSSNDLDLEIVKQGDLVRKLKSEKASKDLIASGVSKLLELKVKYKETTGNDWQPLGVKKSAAADCGESELDNRIRKQGDVVRQLKSNKAPKDQVVSEVNVLLTLKSQYKELFGKDWQPQLAEPKKVLSQSEIGSASASLDKKVGQSSKEREQKRAGINQTEKPLRTESNQSSAALKKQTRLCLEASKEENLSEWYSQVITKGELIEYYDISGCYVLRPWAFAVWEAITAFFDAEIKKLGVQNCYFPMFVSKNALEKEKTHIADFSPEVAWVTRSGESDLAEPIAIRPTSETVMYPSFAKWIKSHRDLPLRINQWCNVVRWEFKHPQPFLRTREFLWQEGHSAFADSSEAEAEVYAILDLYRQVYEDLLAIPVIPGKKTEKEKFAGSSFTTTVEAFVSASGRGLQGATSHHLGQNFSKMFEIAYEDPLTKEKTFVYQNSWGLSTRSIGAMIMIHSDNKGLVLPPKVAATQVIIIPCGITANSTALDKATLLDKCKEYEQLLKSAGIKCFTDVRDNYSPGWKYNHWELKGVPLRVEIGPRDLKAHKLIVSRRDTAEKITVSENEAVKELSRLLEDVHQNLFQRAKKDLDDRLAVLHDWDEFIKMLDNKCIILAPFCGEISCEDAIKIDSTKEDPMNISEGPQTGAKSLCIPFRQPLELSEANKCIYPKCDRKPRYYVLFGRSY